MFGRIYMLDLYNPFFFLISLNWKKKKIQPKLSFPWVLRNCIVLKKKNWLDFSQFLKHGYGKNKIVPIKTNCFQTALHCLAQIICPSIWKWGTMTDWKYNSQSKQKLYTGITLSSPRHSLTPILYPDSVTKRTTEKAATIRKTIL